MTNEHIRDCESACLSFVKQGRDEKINTDFQMDEKESGPTVSPFTHSHLAFSAREQIVSGLFRT